MRILSWLRSLVETAEAEERRALLCLPKTATAPPKGERWQYLRLAPSETERYLVVRMGRDEIVFDAASGCWRHLFRGRGYYDYGVGAPPHRCAEHIPHCFCEGCVNESPCMVGTRCTVCAAHEIFEPDRFEDEIVPPETLLPAGWEMASGWPFAHLFAVKGRRGFEDPRDAPEGKEWAAWDQAARAWRRFTPTPIVSKTPATPCVPGSKEIRVPCCDARHPDPTQSWCPCGTNGGFLCNDERTITIRVDCTNHAWSEHNEVLPPMWGKWLTPPRNGGASPTK